MKRILTILFISTAILSIASEFSSEFAAINHAYLNLDKKMIIRSTTTYESEAPKSQEITVYMKNIDEFYMSDGVTELLVRDKVKLALNHDLKTIMIDKNQTNSVDDLPLHLFDTISRFYKSIKKSVVSENENLYRLIPKAGPSKEINIYYNSKSKLINKVDLKMYDRRVSKNFQISNAYSYYQLKLSDIPQLNKYVIKSNQGEYKLSKNFQSYDLINHFNTK